MCSLTVSMSSVYAPANFPISAKTVFISIINTLGPFHKPKIITLNSKITCKSSIFFWYLRLPISRHQINTSVNQRQRICFAFFFIMTETFKNNKSINLFCRPNTSNLSAGLNNSHYNKNFDTKHCLFFTSVYRYSSDVVFLSRR